MKLKSALLAALLASAGIASAADVVVSGQITTNTTWTASNRYQLSGYVFVTNGATLTIEPGTVVQGRVSSGTSAAALVITAGSKINAAGTKEKPIIFTSELDQLNGNLTKSDTGLWGGLVVLGKASINSRSNGAAAGTPAQDQIEGFSVSADQTSLITFGGTDDADNSGTIRYVSIRHGGAVIGTANEINGLTMGGVGSGTTIEYVEVFANKDDGYEWFGGTVNCRYLVSAYNNDDAFDMDQGYRGNLQFLFGILGDIGTDYGDKGIEWDGSTSPLTATPRGKTTVANATIIGAGTTGKSSYAMNIRDAVEATVYNSVFMNFEKMIDIENDVNDGPNADPVFKNSIFFSQVAANNTAAGLNARPAGEVNATTLLSDSTISIVDPLLTKVDYTATRLLNPLPTATSPALTGAGTVSGTGLVATDYRGAFKDTNWAAGWTKLWNDGYFSEASAGNTGTDVTIYPNSASTFKAISTRGFVGSGDSSMIAGFVVEGTQTKTVLIRGVGPTLATFGVSGTLADPVIEVYKDSTKLTEVDDWTGTQVATVSSSSGAFALTTGSKDAALVLNVVPGNYTVILKGKNGGTGNAILEVYEVK